MDFSYEKNLRKQGFRFIAGIDEVGVGPLAGNVTAAAVTFPAKLKIKNSSRRAIGEMGEKLKILDELRDSKKLTRLKRESFYKIFSEDLEIEYAICSVSEKIIDRINIFEARKLAAKRAILKLEQKLDKNADFVILDGKSLIDIPRKQIAIVKGDEKIALCAIASIIAKVTRDKTMARMHKKYPQYRFDLHKGYGTKLHFEMLKKYGPSPIHRRSFNLTGVQLRKGV